MSLALVVIASKLWWAAEGLDDEKNRSLAVS
jgi:hypothetical protein